jgi:hypothetical protein
MVGDETAGVMAAVGVAVSVGRVNVGITVALGNSVGVAGKEGTVGPTVAEAVGVRVGGGCKVGVAGKAVGVSIGEIGEDWKNPEIAAESACHSTTTAKTAASTSGLKRSSALISCRTLVSSRFLTGWVILCSLTPSGQRRVL